MAWKGIVGKGFSDKTFDEYVHTLQWTQWRPTRIILHNTAITSLATRPSGFSAVHMKGLQKYYRDDMGWRAGPHLFVDDHRIWVFTPLTVSGVHSPSFNKSAIGVEMLGNFATESFTTGRGLRVRENSVAAMATLCAVLGISPADIKLHKEDPLTTHNCPGAKVRKLEVIQEVQDLMLARHGGDHPLDDPHPE